MPKARTRTRMIVRYLQSHARRRINRVDEGDCGRNARAAIALIDAAAYVDTLDDSAPVVARLAVAGCFCGGRFNPGREGELIVRSWYRGSRSLDPVRLLEDLVAAAERSAARTRRLPCPRAASV